MKAMVSSSVLSAALLGVLVFASGCAGSFKHQVDFNTRESLRVAVMPFVQLDSDGQMLQDDGKLLVDKVALVSQEQKDRPTDAVRKLVQAEISRTTALDLLVPVLVDIELPHHGFGLPDGNPDLKKLYNAPPSEVCHRFLDCDAVLYGYIKKWDRSYYGVQTINTVSLELKLVSAKDNRILFSSTAEDTDSRGISKGPTGYTSIVLEPIKGLDSDIIAKLAEDMVRKMLQPLSVQQRDQMLKDPPPAIFATAHDASAEGGVKPGGPLVVVMFGSSKQVASFSIGHVIEDVPMIEHTEGHYVGEFYPLPSDGFNAEQVVVKLQDQYGRSSQQTIQRGPVSVSMAR